MISGLSKC